MTPLLIQNSVGSVVVSLETTGGSPATGLTSSSVQVDIKKATDAFFNNKVLTAPVYATADIGSGANGTVTVSVPGSAGNSYTVQVTSPAGTAPLTVTKTGTALVVALAVSGGVPVGASNTATLIAAAITALLSEIVAVASGTGVDAISVAEGPTALAGGSDGSFTELGAGSYEIDFSASDTDVLGSFTIRVSGSTIRTIVIVGQVATAVSPTPTPTLTIPTTAMFGYVRDVSGNGVANAGVSVRVLSVPTVLHPLADGFVLTSELYSTTTDSNGFFTISLVTGSQVDFFIPVAGYRRTFTVPTASTNVFDLP